MNIWNKLFGKKQGQPFIKGNISHSEPVPQQSSPPKAQASTPAPLPSESPFQKAMKVYRSSQPRHDPDSLDFPTFNASKLQSAYDMFCELVSTNPQDIDALLMRAQCIDDLYDLKLVESALKDLETVLQLNPNEPRAYHLRGSLLCRQFHATDKEKANALAVENFKKVLELDPQYASDMGIRLATKTATNRHFRENLQGHEKVLADIRHGR